MNVKAKSINISIRIITALSRFFLIVLLALYLSKEQLGEFGLLSSYIFFSILLISGNFKQYANRELARSEKQQWAFIISNQIIALLTLYAIFIPLTLLFFQFELLDFTWLYIFYLLLIMGHITLEGQFILNSMLKHNSSSILSFIQNGLWIYLLSLCMFLIPSSRSVEVVFYFWLAGLVLSFLILIYLVKREVTICLSCFFDKKWIIEGYKKSIILLLALLAFQALLFQDRLLLERYGGLDMLGIYVLYIGIVFGVFNIIELGIFTIYSPLLAKYLASDYRLYRSTFREARLVSGLMSTLIMVSLWFGSEVLIRTISGESFLLYIEAFKVLVVAGFLYSLQLLYNHSLNAYKADIFVLVSNLMALFVFILTFVIFKTEPVIYSVSYSLVSAMLFILFFKSIGSSILDRKKYASYER